jgi:lysozyme
MNLALQLEREEGRRRAAYKDHLGYLTIGIGRLIDERKGGGLRDSEIDLLLANDIDEKTSEVRASLPWIDTLDEPRRAVLLGMAFQMGTAGLLGFRNTLAMVQRHDYAGAARGMLNSLWATQTPARAHRMARQLETGEWQP